MFLLLYVFCMFAQQQWWQWQRPHLIGRLAGWFTRLFDWLGALFVISDWLGALFVGGLAASYGRTKYLA